MARINTSGVLKRLQEGLGLSVGREKTPLEVADKVLPVFEIRPIPQIRTLSQSASDVATVNIATTHSNRRTFLHYAQLTVTKDAVSTSLFSSISASAKDRGSVGVLILRYEPTTAGSHHISISFPDPIELEPGTAIAVNNNTAVASIDATGVIGISEEDKEV